MTGRILAAFALAALVSSGQAHAKDLVFSATLGGDKMPTMTGSKATGEARIQVDTDAQTVDVTLDVTGLKLEDLSKNLVPTPMGPIHLHIYGSHDHSNPDRAALVFPVPYGPGYAATSKGFRAEEKGVPYATGAKLVNSRASFDDFVASLQGGRIVVNIHTNRFTDGEISGDVVPAV